MKQQKTKTQLIAEIRSLTKKLRHADRLAGEARRELEFERDTTNRRASWLDEAKRAWGVHPNTSFDIIREQALQLKARNDVMNRNHHNLLPFNQTT